MTDDELRRIYTEASAKNFPDSGISDGLRAVFLAGAKGQQERAAELEAWIAWLEVRIVDVRTPAMWGSHHEFTAQPSDDCAEGEEVGPSNLRDLLRGALARKP